LTGRFELIVANPPYIATEELAVLEPEVAKFDPKLALDGGIDGLDAYRAIIPCLEKHLQPGGTVLFEVGMGQAEQVADLCAVHGLTQAATHRDLAGIARVVEAKIA
jgi:release factor glutamine methyltransferase